MSAVARPSSVFLHPSPIAGSQNRSTWSILIQESRFGPATLRLRRMRPMAAAAAKYKGTKMREEKLSEMIEKKVKEATEVCEADERSEECKVAWDEVEEVSQAKADLRLKLQNQDPLESFCQEHPETDECRIYDD